MAKRLIDSAELIAKLPGNVRGDVPVRERKLTMKREGAKHDYGKLKYSHVPPEVIDAIAVIREYGNCKYSDPDNWRSISPDRWHEALLRHTREIWNDPCHIDEESGLPSLWHLATNAAFLCACLKPELENSIKKEAKK